jgi:hypothetical protein
MLLLLNAALRITIGDIRYASTVSVGCAIVNRREHKEQSLRRAVNRFLH